MAESWQLSGEYLVACNCRVSPCPCVTAGGDPTEGECRGTVVFSIDRGNYGSIDVSGLKVALVDRFQGNILSTKMDAGLLIDDRADERQFEALRTVVSGQAGGTFADIAGLIGNFLGADRARFSFETAQGGESGSVRADGLEFRYTALKGPHGRTELLNGALAFRERIFPGKSEGGRIDHFGIKSETHYGEWSEFEFRGP